MVTAAVVQMTSTAEVERNLSCAEALVRRAAEAVETLDAEGLESAQRRFN